MERGCTKLLSEIETQRNETKRNITQRNILKCETKRNETKYTKMRNATKNPLGEYKCWDLLEISTKFRIIQKKIPRNLILVEAWNWIVEFSYMSLHTIIYHIIYFFFIQIAYYTHIIITIQNHANTRPTKNMTKIVTLLHLKVVLDKAAS